MTYDQSHEIAALEQIVADFRQEYTKLANEHVNQKEELEGLRSANDYLQRQVDEVSRDRSETISQFKGLQNALSEVNLNNLQNIREIHALRDRLAAQQNVAAERDHFKGLVAVRDRELAEVKGHRTNLQGYTSQQAQTIQNRDNYITELKNEILQQGYEITRRDSAIEARDRYIDDLEIQRDDLEFDVRNLEKDNENLLALSQKDAMRIAALNGVIEDLADDLEEMDQYKKHLDSAESDLDKILAQVDKSVADLEWVKGARVLTPTENLILWSLNRILNGEV